MQTIISSFEEIALEIDRLLSKGKDRTILGIVGKPGAGKSTITSKIMEYLGGKSVALFPMDGYHLSNQVLVDLGRRERKGAPDTFDASAFTSLLGRIKYETDKDIYFPIFHREFEESYAAEGVIPAGTKLVLTEGNYLLLDIPEWAGVRPLLDESWYLAPSDSIRQDRLISRHENYGKSKDAAREWALGSDEKNAEIVESTKKYATKIVILS